MGYVTDVEVQARKGQASDVWKRCSGWSDGRGQILGSEVCRFRDAVVWPWHCPCLLGLCDPLGVRGDCLFAVNGLVLSDVMMREVSSDGCVRGKGSLLSWSLACEMDDTNRRRGDGREKGQVAFVRHGALSEFWTGSGDGSALRENAGRNERSFRPILGAGSSGERSGGPLAQGV